MDRLRRLLGTWIGEGSGDYPPIEPFRYRELLCFEERAGEPVIHFEQRTWLLPDEEASHWESGFIRALEDGTVELLNAQNSGRVEVLSGRASTADGCELQLELDSCVHGHDPRVRRTRRVFSLRGDHLHYTQWMETTTTDQPEFLQHLEAQLKRIESSSTVEPG